MNYRLSSCLSLRLPTRIFTKKFPKQRTLRAKRVFCSLPTRVHGQWSGVPYHGNLDR